MGKTLSTWLKQQDPDIWFATTRYLNWDNSFRTLKWIVSQPQCDKANAAEIFWSAGPAYRACQLAKGQQLRPDEGGELIELVLGNWRRGFYQRSELAWPSDGNSASIAYFRRETAAVPGAASALDIPPEMFGRFNGRAPNVPPECTPQENVELWDMLYRQGTWAGPRPGSDEWIAERAKAKSQPKSTGFWNRIFR